MRARTRSSSTEQPLIGRPGQQFGRRRAVSSHRAAYPVRGTQQDWATMLLAPVTILNPADAGWFLAHVCMQVSAGLRRRH